MNSNLANQYSHKHNVLIFSITRTQIIIDWTTTVQKFDEYEYAAMETLASNIIDWIWWIICGIWWTFNKFENN